jgi:hypothetical protein
MGNTDPAVTMLPNCPIFADMDDGSSLMMEAVRTSETSVDNHFTRQYNPGDSSEHHTRRRENLKSHIIIVRPACQEIPRLL